MDESALVVSVPEAEELVSGFRRKYDPVAAQGITAHITLLSPFMHPRRLTNQVLSELRSFFESTPRFEFILVGPDRFGEEILYLSPEPAAVLNDLTRALWSRYPDFPPYEGAFSDVVAHLTLGRVPPAASIDELESEFAEVAGGALPIRCHVIEAKLLVSHADLWTEHTSFLLGAF